MSEKYNGWTNYETWNWKLWLDNEEGSYRHWTRTAEAAYAEAVESDDDGDRESWTDTAVSLLRTALEEECDSALAEYGTNTGPFSDLLTAAVGEINWHEIATAYIEDLDRDGIEADARAVEVTEDE